MYVRFAHAYRRVYLSLCASHRVDGAPRALRLGSLGTIAYSEPFAASERAKFWAQFDARLDAIRAHHPISPADEEKVREMVARRIPFPQTREDHRLQQIALAQLDLIDALARGPDGGRAFEEVAVRLVKLARQGGRPNPKSRAERTV